MFVLGLIIGGVIGGCLVGEVAHRKPEWFAKVVSVANTVADKANEVVDKVKQ